MYIKRFISSTSLLWIVTIATLTTFGSEIKIVPFYDTTFRFGLGSIIFFLCTLLKRTPLIWAGITTSVITVFFRATVDFIYHDKLLIESILSHLPAALFYLVFSISLHQLKIHQYRESPLKLGFSVALSEVLSNLVEQYARYLLHAHIFLFMDDLLILLAVALLRSFFVVGIYSSILIAEQKKRVQEMLHISSGLYVESLYLKKSMNHIETITMNGFDLYRQLKEQGHRAESLQALYIAQEIHEVKKDSQRIYAGISKIVGDKNLGSFQLSELLDYIESSNKKYSTFLEKDIRFNFTLECDFKTDKYSALLALLNNLTANSIEAIALQGSIDIHIQQIGDNTIFSVSDNGQGISNEELSIIFEPGFTTKYNEEGVASTGIGLSHVATLVTNLNGTISVQSNPEKTMFKISIPTQTIQTGET